MSPLSCAHIGPAPGSTVSHPHHLRRTWSATHSLTDAAPIRSSTRSRTGRCRSSTHNPARDCRSHRDTPAAATARARWHRDRTRSEHPPADARHHGRRVLDATGTCRYTHAPRPSRSATSTRIDPGTGNHVAVTQQQVCPESLHASAGPGLDLAGCRHSHQPTAHPTAHPRHTGYRGRVDAARQAIGDAADAMTDNASRRCTPANAHSSSPGTAPRRSI